MNLKAFVLPITVTLLLCSCENINEQASPTEDFSETATTETVTESVADSAAKKTGKAKKQPTPLTAGKNKAYYEDEDFSVTAELTDLCSSLYYPDVVHDMGANPELFTVTVKVNAKNMSEEEKTFDASKFSLSELFYIGGNTEKFENIKPAKTVSGELRFLCSLEQAAQINGIFYGNEYLETGENFYPEKFDDIIEIQSADDVRDYLYREFVIRGTQEGYFTLNAAPVIYQVHHMKAIESEGKNYLTMSYTAYNRSDYAQLIEPAAFVPFCGQRTYRYEDTERVYPLYISTDPDYIYEPKEAELKLKGVGQLYEMPEFICMNPDNPTVFTVVYDFKDNAVMWRLMFEGSHDEPYYSDPKRDTTTLGAGGWGLNWDAWEEKRIED